jgi:cyclopropane-fatty-acyl-phospholipid synthase
MMCHVGQKRADEFYDKLQALSAPGAIVLTHCISKMKESSGSDPFVEKHVFPGYWFFSLEGETNRAVDRGFNVLDVENLRRHYAMTAHHWRKRFLANYEAIKRKMRFDERFMRTWDFYLASVVAGFRAGHLNLIQMTMSQGINDEYPLTREFLYERERPSPVIGRIPTFPLRPRMEAPS